MQFSNNTKPVWGDRNPVSQAIGYSATSVAPHATTVRATYTVPTGRKAAVSGVFTQIYIDGVAATPIEKETWIQVTTNSITMRLAESFIGRETNVIASQVNSAFGGAWVLLASDAISVVTYNGSTGGTCAHRGSVAIIEYDA